MLSPEAYALVLDGLSHVERHVRLQVYVHYLGSRDDVVEWVKGTLLTDHERRLTPGKFLEFLARYRERLPPFLEDNRPYVHPFKRILLWARLPSRSRNATIERGQMRMRLRPARAATPTAGRALGSELHEQAESIGLGKKRGHRDLEHAVDLVDPDGRRRL